MLARPVHPDCEIILVMDWQVELSVKGQVFQGMCGKTKELIDDSRLRGGEAVIR